MNFIKLSGFLNDTLNFQNQCAEKRIGLTIGYMPSVKLENFRCYFHIKMYLLQIPVYLGMCARVFHVYNAESFLTAKYFECYHHSIWFVCKH